MANLRGTASATPTLSGTLQKTVGISGRLQKLAEIGGELSNVALQGYSAYEIAVQHGYTGTEEEWLQDLHDYEKLNNKPLINGVTVTGNKTFEDYGLSELSSKEVSDIFNSIFYN